jgi:hypothetical protein
VLQSTSPTSSAGAAPGSSPLSGGAASPSATATPISRKGRGRGSGGAAAAAGATAEEEEEENSRVNGAGVRRRYSVSRSSKRAAAAAAGAAGGGGGGGGGDSKASDEALDPEAEAERELARRQLQLRREAEYDLEMARAQQLQTQAQSGAATSASTASAATAPSPVAASAQPQLQVQVQVPGAGAQAQAPAPAQGKSPSASAGAAAAAAAAAAAGAAEGGGVVWSRDALSVLSECVRGVSVVKHSRAGSPALRTLRLEFWPALQLSYGAGSGSGSALPLAACIAVRPGLNSEVLQRSFDVKISAPSPAPVPVPPAPAVATHCLSVLRTPSPRTLDVQFSDSCVRDRWAEALRQLIACPTAPAVRSLLSAALASASAAGDGKRDASASASASATPSASEELAFDVLAAMGQSLLKHGRKGKPHTKLLTLSPTTTDKGGPVGAAGAQGACIGGRKLNWESDTCLIRDIKGISAGVSTDALRRAKKKQPNLDPKLVTPLIPSSLPCLLARFGDAPHPRVMRAGVRY